MINNASGISNIFLFIYASSFFIETFEVKLVLN